MQNATVHVPAHFDAEVPSTLAGLISWGIDRRGGGGTSRRPRRAPSRRHPLQDLTEGGWSRRNTQRLADAFFEFAEQLRSPLITNDRRLASSYSRVHLPWHQPAAWRKPKVQW
jgi:predicted nucleic acid-binding protein